MFLHRNTAVILYPHRQQAEVAGSLPQDPVGSLAMPKTRALLQAFVGAVAPALAGGACLQPYVSVDTTAFSFSGCFKETIYAGTYETVVWTMDGLDVVDTGTQAISASLVRHSMHHSNS